MSNTRSVLLGLPWWSWLLPLVAGVTLVAAWGAAPGTAVLAWVAAVLIAAVLVAVHHAEVVAHRVGEPLGTLVLALAVTMDQVGGELHSSLLSLSGAALADLAIATYRCQAWGVEMRPQPPPLTL